MAINIAGLREALGGPEAQAAWKREWDRWHALTPEEQKAERAEVDKRLEKSRKHIAWLDYCVAKKIDPNLVS